MAFETLNVDVLIVGAGPSGYVELPLHSMTTVGNASLTQRCQL